ncbi:hypothetical protein EON65_44940 [archaeon]|nr:MAG: hypothetical protein EON65_44940 [archaeon]
MIGRFQQERGKAQKRKKAYYLLWRGYFTLTLLSSYHVIGHAFQGTDCHHSDSSMHCWKSCQALGSRRIDSTMLPATNAVACK